MKQLLINTIKTLWYNIKIVLKNYIYKMREVCVCGCVCVCV